MATTCFLGTGLIGAALAEAAARRGESVVVWNRTRAKAEALEALDLGIVVADDPVSAMADAARVHLAFPDDAVVDRVLETLGDIPDGAVLIDHTTSAPLPTAARAAHLAERGIAYVHAPVFMSPTACRNATGMIVAAGPDAAWSKVSAAVGRMTGAVRYLGEDMRRAAAFKLFGNCLIISNIAALADVFAMAHALDIDPEDARSLFDQFNPAVGLDFRGRKMAQGDFTPNFELTMARKDVRLMQETAGDRSLAVLPGIAARMDALLAEGLGDLDFGVLAGEFVAKD